MLGFLSMDARQTFKVCNLDYLYGKQRMNIQVLLWWPIPWISFCVGYPSNLNFNLTFMNVYLLQ